MKNNRVLKILLTAILFSLKTISLQAQSQLECGTEISFPESYQLTAQFEQDVLMNPSDTGIYSIPVIFHIIHGGEAIGTFPNLPAGQINSQISVLNLDIRGQAANTPDYPLNAFVNWAAGQNIPPASLDALGRIKIADFGIQFCAALTDPQGNLLSEPGIERINYLEKGWPPPDQFATQATMKSYLDNVVKPQSIWDVRKYLNVWVSNKSSSLSYGGVSSVPPFSGIPDISGASTTDSTDGIWLFSKVVGSAALFPDGIYISPFIDGRTMTHEAGHYLGLRHIWGDAACGNDFCTDTPPADAQNTGLPAYPLDPGSCSSPSNSPDGEMFMNFMDYTAGPGKYMFTPDQRSRARTAMINSPFRNQLGTHGICSGTTKIASGSRINSVLIRYNQENQTASLTGLEKDLKRLFILDCHGKVLREENSDSFRTSSLNAGLYYVKIETGGGLIIVLPLIIF